MAKKQSKSPNASQWGSLQWLEAYRYSDMDKRRKARAEAAVGDKFMKSFKKGPDSVQLMEKLDSMMTTHGVKLTEADMKRFAGALAVVRDYEIAIYDAVFASALGKVWHVGDQKKGEDE